MLLISQTPNRLKFQDYWFIDSHALRVLYSQRYFLATTLDQNDKTLITTITSINLRINDCEEIQIVFTFANHLRYKFLW